MEHLNQKQIKIENSRLILHHLSMLGESNRSELSRITGLSRPTVSSLTEDLIRRGYLCEKGHGLSSGGKRPTLLAINKETALFLSIDFSDWKIITVTLLNLTGEIEQQFKEKIKEKSSNIQKQIVHIIDHISDIHHSRLKAIIFPVRGILNKDKTEIVEQVKPTLAQDFFTHIASKSPVPLFLERNAHAATFGEWKLNYRNQDELLYLSLGKGVSAGMIIHGKLYRGPLFAAGEIAHLPVNNNGAPCICGQTGCLETELLENTIIHAIGKLKNKTVTENELQGLIDDMDEQTEIVLCELADKTARAIRILMELLNIPRIVLGGRFLSFGEVFLKQLQKSLYTTSAINTITYFKDDTHITFSSANKNITALGAGLLLIDKYLNFEL